MARIYILDDSPTALSNIERALTASGMHELSGSSSRPQEALQQIESLHPDVIIIDLDLKDADAASIIREVRRATSWIVIVAMSANDDDATLELARGAGAQEFLPKPFARDELFGAIESALRHQAAVTPAEYDNAVQTNKQPQGPQDNYQVISVTGPKGGTGASVIAANLALLASQEGGRHTLLIDLDIQHGSLRRLLRLESTKSIDSMMEGFSSGPDVKLQGTIVPGPAGVSVLLAPSIANLQRPLTYDFVEGLITTARRSFDFIVIDVPDAIDANTLTALRASDRILLISSTTDLSVHASQATIAMYSAYGISKDHLAYILNRSEVNSDLSATTVESLAGLDIFLQFPYDPIVVSASVNRGVPFVLQKPDSQMARKVRELAQKLLPSFIRKASEEGEEGVPALAAVQNAGVPASDQGRKQKKRRFGFTKS